MIKAIIFDMYETLVTLKSDESFFGKDILRELNIEEEKFNLWYEKEYERTVGILSLKDLLTLILEENNIYSDKLLNRIIEKRYEARRIPFKNLHPSIIPMLKELKNEGIKIGLISNSFSEEVDTIKESLLFPYFDATCFSYEEHVMKPSDEIFERMISKLNLKYEECIYVGDGGSDELKAAKELGMKSLKANWYINRDLNFEGLDDPLKVLSYVK